ncbi:SDR family oxidoreductase [Ciceribacter ferrooxidans]|uniref:SDR family oxidoreductase n=1 Tax=Ciceribacter ferrooxidans TaxID=2509717 RepID=A0A4Q2T1T0_9HYPH|nr:SDR family oxidoreductase [Ciceribacter ferrooxidans]RYC12402.1 SDR family oxidoreductase [Ciceribacter ferrooxidans]
MDLGIKGKRALVCAGSKGLGRAVAEKLAEAGVILTLNAREPGQLRTTAEAIGDTYGTHVETVAADVTTEEGRNALLRAEPQPDILITNAGGPPPGDWSTVTEDDWLGAVGANMLAPILLMQAVLPGMVERKWGRIVNITSASVRSPIPELCLSNGSRTGLTGFVAGTARQVARHGVTINNLLPGSHRTERMEKLLERSAERRGISIDEARAEEYAQNPTGRVGTPDEFGAAAAFLCSQYAGYIVGQNLLLDGGAFNATF